MVWLPRDPKRTKNENEQKNKEKRCPDCETGRARSEPAAESKPGVQDGSDAEKQQGDAQSSAETEQPIEVENRAIAAGTAEAGQVDHAGGRGPRDPTYAADQVERTAQAASVESDAVGLESSRGEQVANEEHVVRVESEGLARVGAPTEAQAAEVPASLDWDEEFLPLPALLPAVSGGTSSMHSDFIVVTRERSSLDQDGLGLPQVDVPGAASTLVKPEQNEQAASESAEPGPQNGHAVEQSNDDDQLLDGEYDMLNEEVADEGVNTDGEDDILNGEEGEDGKGHGVVDDYGIPLQKELPPRPDEA